MDEQERLEATAATLEQLPLLVAVAEGSDLRLVTMNGAARSVVGERPLDEPMAGWPGVPAREIVARCRRTWETGVPDVAREWRLEVAGADGLPLEVFVDLTFAPVTRADGSVRAVVAYGQDVTDRVREREDGRHHRDPAELRYLEAAELVVQVQDALLPTGVPVPPGLEIAARYLVAEDYAGAGGDWFDAAVLDDGRVALSVGDVVGQGVAAAATMGELKALYDERIREDGDVAAALSLLDRRSHRQPGARGATVAACVLDPVTGVLEYCTAGHPPPIVVSATGSARYLEISGGGPLHSGGGFPVAHDRLEPHEVLVLYSDGLVERPERTPARSTVEIARVMGDTVRGAADPAEGERLVEAVCRRSLERLVHGTGYADDIALLAAQRVAPLEQLRLRMPAVPGAVRAVRAETAAWLARLRVGMIDEIALQHALGELVTNAVQHAYAGSASSAARDAEVRVTVGLRPDGRLEAEVADDGRWRDSHDVREDDEERGRGLAMVRGFVDELEIDHGVGGTRAVLRHRLTQPVTMLRGVATAPRPTVHGRPAEMERDRGAVRVTGDVDRDCAARLAHVLARAGRGGSRSVHLDLAGVSLLSSAAVQVLVDASAAGGLHVRAPWGSPAQHVLELVRVPYES